MPTVPVSINHAFSHFFLVSQASDDGGPLNPRAMPRSYHSDHEEAYLTFNQTARSINAEAHRSIAALPSRQVVRSRAFASRKQKRAKEERRRRRYSIQHGIYPSSGGRANGGQASFGNYAHLLQLYQRQRLEDALRPSGGTISGSETDTEGGQLPQHASFDSYYRLRMGDRRFDRDSDSDIERGKV